MEGRQLKHKGYNLKPEINPNEYVCQSHIVKS